MRHQPPRLASGLLGRILPEKDREAVLGDLAEEYALRARSTSPLSVAHWYWRQVCRSIPRVVWCFVRRGCWLRTLTVAIGAYIAAGMIEFAGDAAISRLFPEGALIQAALGVIAGLATMALAGYIAARIRAGAEAALAGIVATSVVVLMATRSDSAPLWYQLAFLIGGPVASWAGGTLFQRSQA
jgi:hypothetical protein